MSLDSLDLRQTRCKEALQRLLKPKYLSLIPTWLQTANKNELGRVCFLADILDDCRAHVFGKTKHSLYGLARPAPEALQSQDRSQYKPQTLVPLLRQPHPEAFMPFAIKTLNPKPSLGSANPSKTQTLEAGGGAAAERCPPNPKPKSIRVCTGATGSAKTLNPSCSSSRSGRAQAGSEGSGSQGLGFSKLQKEPFKGLGSTVKTPIQTLTRLTATETLPYAGFRYFSSAPFAHMLDAEALRKLDEWQTSETNAPKKWRVAETLESLMLFYQAMPHYNLMADDIAEQHERLHKDSVWRKQMQQAEESDVARVYVSDEELGFRVSDAETEDILALSRKQIAGHITLGNSMSNASDWQSTTHDSFRAPPKDYGILIPNPKP